MTTAHERLKSTTAHLELRLASRKRIIKWEKRWNYKTVHNLNEFIEIRVEDISTNFGAELINDVSNKKLDKTVHNLNEFIEIRAKDISTNVGAELINDVSNKKLGIVMNENQLEEFFSLVSQ
ncbi:hypothetical protein Q3G72_033137 [Acer saccharum]|nr:hypothetical protein Q3G72_033137 [Acer saccharum]